MSGDSVMYNSVAVIGGDKRMLYCAKAFADDGARVMLSGFEKLKGVLSGSCYSVYEAVLCSDLVVLPVPCVIADHLNAPLSAEQIYFDDKLLSALKGKRVFCGIKDKLLLAVPKLDKSLVYDYSQREEFAVDNAVATAEGAIEIAMREYEGTISHSRCLVCGYGRIGRALTNMLCALNADVTVSARKPHDFAWINTTCATAVNTAHLASLEPFDIIFNTVPALVFDSKVLSHIAKDALFIDLASMPGGVDFESANRMGISTIHALSLPGKAAPKTAGEIIKKTITNMLEEDDGCQKFA